MARSRLALCAVAIAVACHPPSPRRRAGAVAGLARDREGGVPLAGVEIVMREQGAAKAFTTRTSDKGMYDIDRVWPGHYRLVARYHGQVIEVDHIQVSYDRVTSVDLAFDRTRRDRVVLDYGDRDAGTIDRYRPVGELRVGLIEGTVADVITRERVVGAVVTAVRPSTMEVHQEVTDEQGRFRFRNLAPSSYSLSAYYSIAYRGQVEVQRNGIEVAAGEAVVVPLWIEVEPRTFN